MPQNLMLKKILIVGLFGFLGATSRYFIYEILKNTTESYLITLFINVLGAGILGRLNQYSFLYRKEILSGYLGSFTTFATLESEFLLISEYHAFFYELVYLLISLALGYLAFEAGHRISQRKPKETIISEQVFLVNEIPNSMEDKTKIGDKTKAGDEN